VIASLILSNAGINEVVRRTRGMWIVNSDQQSTYEDGFAALGFVVVNDLAGAAGAASIPGPVTDADDDGWFVWEPMIALVGGGTTGGGAGAAFSPVQGARFDSKAMRRIPEGFEIAVMVENASAVFSIEVAVAFSMLTSRA